MMTRKVNRNDYAKLDWATVEHHQRYVRRIATMPRKLTCQNCKGAGGEREVLLDDGSGPWYPCGWCEGTGYVLPHRRGEWLRYCAMLARPRRADP